MALQGPTQAPDAPPPPRPTSRNIPWADPGPHPAGLFPGRMPLGTIEVPCQLPREVTMASGLIVSFTPN